MKGTAHRIVKLLRKKLFISVAAGIALFSPAMMAVAGTLNVGVSSPTPPITESDVITLAAITSDQVLPDTGYETFTTSLVINGFDIEWELISYNTFPTITLPFLLPASKAEDIGPLQAGTYNVTATWTLYPSEPINNWPLPIDGPRVGTYEFTVVPEPTTLMLTSAVGLYLIGKRRR